MHLITQWRKPRIAVSIPFAAARFQPVSSLAGSKLLPRALRGQQKLVVERDLKACWRVRSEYEEVIRRPKFGRSEAVVENALGAIRRNGFWVRPSENVSACPDADDDIFLECAQAARAHYLVTGNVKRFPTKWADTQIVMARGQFLDAVAESRGEPK